jgi:streptogrisin C
MYDSSRGWNYIMTAGHCATGGPLAGITYSYSADYHPVSYEVFNFENGGSGYSTYPYDYSIQPYSDYDYWSGPYAKNRVVSYCWWSPSTWQGCVDGTFEITGYYPYQNIGIGWVVCGTGSGDNSPDSGYQRGYSWHPGTYCGEVRYKDGGIGTNICTREGDSGGPLFSEIDGRAYGILSGGTPGSGPCPFDPPGTESSWYSPIDKILLQVKTQTMYYENKDYGFQLRTWP